MLLICKNLLPHGCADFIGEKRFIYDEGKPEGAKVEAPKGPEKKEVTAEDVDKAKENFMKEKAALEKKLDEYAKSDNPAILKAVETAKADLKRFDESGSLSMEAIKNQLNYIQLTLQYFEWKPKLDSNVKKIETAAEKTKSEWVQSLNSMVDGILKDNPNLPKEQADKIRSMVADYSERMDGAIQVAVITGTPDKDLTFEEFLLAPERLNTALLANQHGYDLFTNQEKAPALYKNLDDLYNEMEQRCDAQVCIGQAAEQKNSITYLQNYQKEAKELLVHWGKQFEQNIDDKMAKLDVIFSNGMAALNALDKPIDGPKRALVLANIRDQIDFLYTGKPKQKNPNSITDQYTLVEQTMKQMGEHPDKYFAGFEKGKLQPSDEKLGLKEKVQDKGLRYVTVGSPNFRLEGSGARIMTLPPNAVLQIVDSNVMVVETSDGKKVHYVKVRMSPPNGPVGYISQNNINFQKSSIDLDVETPEVKKQTTA